MLIVCNRRGGFGLHGLSIAFGTNHVTEAEWAKAKSTLNADWLHALMEPGANGAPPQIIVLDNESRPPEMNAKDKAALVASCESLEEIEVLAHNEARKTVLRAIDRRIDELSEAA